jgi:hypothetical protein
MVWHNLTTKPGLTTQEARSIVKATPAKPVGTPQLDPWPLLDPYTHIPMADIKDILDWELDPNLAHP